MPRIVFAPAIQRHQPCPPLRVAGATVNGALAAAFAEKPQMRDYILDDQGTLRRHVAIFVDGQVVKDRLHLSDPAGENAEIYVVQALSGG
ncbi:MoaD/ThiS family protein [Azoarcus sp. PA01]|nr:MoaD/ThiS family protein [Azoarcus sp. PA01]